MRFCRLLALVSAGLAVGLGVLALASYGWFYCGPSQWLPTTSDQKAPLLAAWVPDAVPMAPSTALGFLVLGAALAGYQLGPPSRWGRRLLGAIALLASAWTMFAFIDLGLHQTQLPASIRDLPGVRIGLELFRLSGMSPLTAASFFLAGLTLLMLGRSTDLKNCYQGTILAGILIAVNLSLVLGFFHNRQLFEKTLRIPVALPTALAFVFLGLGLWAAAGPRSFLMRLMFGRDAQSILLRAFLPVVVVGIMAGDAIRTWLETGSGTEDLRVAFVGLWVYVMVAVLAVVVAGVARVVGGALARSQEQLRDARHRAEEANRAKDMLLTNVSHELRTPLNHIVGYGKLLEETALTDEQRTDLRRVLRAGGYLALLIDDLLDYQKIALGQVRLDWKEFEAGPEIRDLVDIMGLKAAERCNQLRIECVDPVRIRADKQRFRQVLTNLLSNACKFTSQGTVTVSACRQTQGGRDGLQVSVADTGKGIVPAEQRQLFQPFALLIDRRENPNGHGLGLAICKGLCEQMGGSVGLVASEPGKGSTFAFWLAAAGVGPAATADQVPDLAKSTVAASAEVVLPPSQ